MRHRLHRRRGSIRRRTRGKLAGDKPEDSTHVSAELRGANLEHLAINCDNSPCAKGRSIASEDVIRKRLRKTLIIMRTDIRNAFIVAFLLLSVCALANAEKQRDWKTG